MEIKKLECPSCGAPLEWNAPLCNFCKTEIRYFENNSSALPTNLMIEDIENNIISQEIEFWRATVDAIKAPYSRFKSYKHYKEQNFKDDYFNNSELGNLLKMFYDSYFILPSENLVVLIALNNIKTYALLTSLRLIIIRDTTLLSIPLERFISWNEEKSASGQNVVGRTGREMVGQFVLRYTIGDKEVSIRFDPEDLHILDEVMLSVISCKEWEDLSPLQRNLLTVNRYNINKTYKIQVNPLVLMQHRKKGCFVATATFGDYNHPIVIYLQGFRDSYLTRKSWGLKFINWYYNKGPFIARKIDKSYSLKKLSFWLIIKPAVLISKIIKHF